MPLTLRERWRMAEWISMYDEEAAEMLMRGHGGYYDADRRTGQTEIDSAGWYRRIAARATREAAAVVVGGYPREIGERTRRKRLDKRLDCILRAKNALGRAADYRRKHGCIGDRLP